MMKPFSCPDCTRGFGDKAALVQHRQATHRNPKWVTERALKQAKAGLGDAPATASGVRTSDLAPAPQCPRCGNPAALSMGRFGLKAECCGLWSWKGKPLVDRDTHASRIQAHAAFDRIWQVRGFSRTRCYRALAHLMAMTSEQCHIALMNAQQARMVIDLVKSGAVENELRRHDAAKEGAPAA